MLSLIPWYWRAFGVLGLAVACLCFGYIKGEGHEQVSSLEAQGRAMLQAQPVVVQYVRQIVEVERNFRGNVLPNLSRLCVIPSVPSAGHPDAAAAPDPHAGDTVPADPGTILGLADDITSCTENSIQLGRLQEVLKPQLPKTKRWWEIWK